MAPFRNLRPNWLILLITLSAVLAVATFFGELDESKGSLWLLPLIVLIWMLEPRIISIAVIALAVTNALAPQWFAIIMSGIPQPATILLIIAAAQIIQVEVKARARLKLRKSEMLAQQKEQEELPAFFAHCPAAMLVADGEGRIITANPAAQNLLGRGKQSLLKGQGLAPNLMALASALRIERRNTLSHALLGCNAWRLNGEMFVADTWFSVYDTPSGTRLGAVLVDASERLQDRARVGLRSSTETSQIAMGAVLHEIRNLSSAADVMYSNLARGEQGRPSELQRNPDFEALGALLKGLANLASAELRPGEGSHTSVDLVGVIAQFRIIIDPWFGDSEITVTWDIAPDLPHVFGEESGLLQIFLNIAQNSYKALASEEEKQFSVQVRVQGGWVVVRFQDTGAGVKKPDELFEPFRRSTGIKGLGLYVSRAIAHSFYGELRYMPVVSGTCFEVELLPSREWQKVVGRYEGTVEHQNPSH